MRTLFTDIAAAFRGLRRQTALASLAIGVLGLGVGVNTAFFTAVRTILLAPLSFPGSDRLVQITQINPHLGGLNAVSPGNYLSLTRSLSALPSVSAYQTTRMTMTGNGRPAELVCARVTANFLPILGTRPELGRAFNASDTVTSGADVATVDNGAFAILSHRAWVERFGGRADILNRPLTLDGRSYEIVGVMPAGFEFPDRTELWVPLSFGPVASRDWGTFSLRLVGRLAPQSDLAQAQAQATTVAIDLHSTAPVNRDVTFHIVALKDALVYHLRPTLFALYAGTTLILLVVCANVANLLLARATYRQREVAIRAALGADMKRIARQLLTESLVLAWCGAIVGAGVASLALRALLAIAPSGIIGDVPIHMDVWAFLYMTGLATATGMAVGFAPLLFLSRHDVAHELVEGGRGVSGGTRQRRVQGLLISVELALAMILVTCTGLLVQSYRTLAHEHLGFRASELFVADFTLPEQRYATADAVDRFVARAVDAAQSDLGTTAIAASSRLPVADEPGGVWFQPGSTLEKDVTKGRTEATFYVVTPTYFRVMSIPIRRGRAFNETDRTGGVPVVAISEELARRFFPGQDPIGQRLILTPWPTMPREIVSVVGDVKQGSMDASASPAIYVPYAQVTKFAFIRMHLFVRGANVDSVGAGVGRAISAVDPTLAIDRSGSMQHLISEQLRPARFTTWLIGLFSVLSLTLALTGVYGVVTYTTSLRTHEIGVRMALGATEGMIMTRITGEWLRQCIIGIATGIIGAAVGASMAHRLLFQVAPTDPLTYLSTALLLFTAVAIATIIPARRAVRAEPASALRGE